MYKSLVLAAFAAGLVSFGMIEAKSASSIPGTTKSASSSVGTTKSASSPIGTTQDEPTTEKPN